MSEGPVPDDMAQEVEARRAELVERVSEVRRAWPCCARDTRLLA
jgi:hypothetical protein